MHARKRHWAAWFVAAIAAGGCDAALVPGTDAGAGGHSSGGAAGSASGDGPVFCRTTLGDACTFSLIPGANVCRLPGGIEAACHPCGQQADGCVVRGALVHGTRYTYVQILNVDAAFVFVYDGTEKLIAELGWSANLSAWSCTAGPADFDPSEATSLLPVFGPGDLTAMCAG
jgi:hypothetical protein